MNLRRNLDLIAFISFWITLQLLIAIIPAAVECILKRNNNYKLYTFRMSILDVSTSKCISPAAIYFRQLRKSSSGGDEVRPAARRPNYPNAIKVIKAIISRVKRLSENTSSGCACACACG